MGIIDILAEGVARGALTLEEAQERLMDELVFEENLKNPDFVMKMVKEYGKV